MMQDLNDTLPYTRALAIAGNPAPGRPQAQAENPSSHPGASFLGEVIQAAADESLDARIESLNEAIAASVCDLRSSSHRNRSAQ